VTGRLAGKIALITGVGGDELFKQVQRLLAAKR